MQDSLLCVLGGLKVKLYSCSVSYVHNHTRVGNAFTWLTLQLTQLHRQLHSRQDPALVTYAIQKTFEKSKD